MTGYYIQKNWRFVLLAGGVCIALFLVIQNVDFGWISKSMTDKGTNIGYQRCLEQNKGQGLEDAALGRLCRKKHEQLIHPKYQAKGGYAETVQLEERFSQYGQGIASLRPFLSDREILVRIRAKIDELRAQGWSEKQIRELDRPWSFSGWIENKSDDMIITSFAVEVKHEDNKDSSGRPIIETLQIEDVWIEPGRNTISKNLVCNLNPKRNVFKSGKSFCMIGA